MSVEPESEWSSGWVGLRRFVQARGSAQVPPRAVAGGIAVGRWVSDRRADYWAGKLAPARVARLESLPGWNWDGPARKRWESRLTALSRYAEQHGTAMASPNAVVGKIRVGEWAVAQRASYTAGYLPGPLAAQLEALPGWEWAVEDERWQRGLRAARAYVGHGTLDVAPDSEVDGFRLGHWVRRCQEDHHAATLTPAQIDALNHLPG